MKTSARSLLAFVVLFSATILSPVHSQWVDRDDPSGAIETQLLSRIRSQFGNDYRAEFSVLDSAIKRNETTSDSGEMSDPYGSLRGCILFGADKVNSSDSKHGIMGIYKDGQVIWHSEPIFEGEWYGIYTIKDINRDGKVDILVEWTPGAQMIMVTHLWIITWDGSTGAIINQVNPTTGNTTIHAAARTLESISIDTVSASVLRGYWPDEEDFSSWFPNISISTLPYVTYSWNGQQYGLWPTTAQTGKSDWLPANLLRVATSCKVTSQADSMTYQYVIENSASSQQSLTNYALAGLCSSYAQCSNAFWDYWGYMTANRLAIWTSHLDPSKAAKAGKSIDLILRSKCIPAIVRYYAQGLRPTPESTPLDADPNAGDQFVSDLLNNSNKGFTVGPANPPDTFVPLNFLDTVLTYTTQSRSLGWIKGQSTADKYVGYFASTKSQLQANNTAGARTTLQTVLQDVNVDSTSNLTSEAYALIRYNTEYLLGQLPTAPPPSGLGVKLINSTGTNLTGGALQYYDGTWKDATNNNDGMFRVNTTLSTVSLRMTYEGGSQTKSNVAVGPDVVVFQTVNTQVKLQNSTGSAIDTGRVQYYFSSWKDFGATTSGVARKELLPANYTFRMTYATASNDKQQDIGTNPTVVFSTVNAAVQMKNSLGNFIDQGTVQYYFSSWQDLGTITNGVATKELLPGNYTFRMSYASATNDKQQNIGTNPTVVFSTVNATVQLKNSQGSFIDQGTVQYYFSSWKTLGSTANGVAMKELLPASYTFRMTYETVTIDKVQNIATNSTVSFPTVLCTVRVKNAQGQPVDGAQVSYYFSSWRTIGATVGGRVTKELLPASLTFRETIGSATQNKVQNVGTNALVEFVVQ